MRYLERHKFSIRQVVVGSLVMWWVIGLAYLTYPTKPVQAADCSDYMRRQTEALESIQRSLDTIAQKIH